MNRTGGQLKQPQPELERGKKLQKQEPRRPDKPETQAQANGEEPPDDAVDRGASPKTPPQGKRPSQPGGNKSTQRQTGSQGEPAVLGKELSQFQASLRVKTDTTSGTERWPQEGGGTTRLTVSKPGIDINPGRATSPKKLARLESDI